MNGELVSVIVPTYNRADTIERAIKSIIKQTYTNWELIIIDDGSVDNIKKVVKPYLNNQIKFYENGHKGVCAARNKGIELSKGKYLAFLDSDDDFLENKLEIQLREIKKFKADMLLCNFYEYREYKKVKERFNFNKSFLITKRTIVQYDIPMSASFMFLKKDLAQKVLFRDGLPSSNDFDFVLRCADKGKLYFSNYRLVNTFKTMKGNRISTNYKGKIDGYNLLVTNISDYKLDLELKNILLKRTYQNLCIFYLFDNNSKDGLMIFKKMSLEFPEVKYSLKLNLIKIALFFPKLSKFMIDISIKIWSIGVLQN